MPRFITALFCVFLIACQSDPKTSIQIVDGKERTIDYTEFQNLLKKTGYTDFKAGELNVSTGKLVILDPVFIENSILLAESIKANSHLEGIPSLNCTIE